MKTLRPAKKWVLASIGLLLALLILKMVLFLTANPKITVDYVAEYNRTARPKDYDPNENAAPYYQKAFDVFVAMPNGLQKPYINWPADFNGAEQVLLQNWFAANSQAFESFREAVNKSYYWLERKSEKDNTVAGLLLPELDLLNKLTKALVWNSKFHATGGQSQIAFEYILDCYRAGKQKCRPNLLLLEQYVGLKIKQEALRCAFVVLDKSKVDSKSLKFLQDAIQQELEIDAYVPGCAAEKLYLYDTLQRTFVDNGKGTGRLWWRVGFDIVVPLCGEGKIYECKIAWSCFTGPTKRDAADQIEQTADIFNKVMAKTPWEIKVEGRDYFGEIENINKRYIVCELLHLCIDSKGIFQRYHKTKAQTEALIAVLAILRYKNDSGQFPESLDKLVSAGYLKAIPQDPYSNSPLIYKPTETNFKLYSVGPDFKDDGGVIKLDIIYWPVQQQREIKIETEKQHHSGKILLPKKLKTKLN